MASMLPTAEQTRRSITYGGVAHPVSAARNTFEQNRIGALPATKIFFHFADFSILGVAPRALARATGVGILVCPPKPVPRVAQRF